MYWPDEYPGFEIFAGRHRLRAELGSNEQMWVEPGHRLEVTFGAVGGFVELEDGTILTTDPVRNWIGRIDVGGNVSTFARIPSRWMESGIEHRDHFEGRIDSERDGSVLVLGKKVVHAVSATGEVRTLLSLHNPPDEVRGSRHVYSEFTNFKLGPDGLLYLICRRASGAHEKRAIFWCQQFRDLETILIGGDPGDLVPDSIATHPNGRLCVGGCSDEVVLMNRDGSNREEYASLDFSDPTTDEYYGGNTIRDIAFDRGSNMYLAGGYSGPFRVDSHTREISRVGAFPEATGCGTVHVKRHNPYRGHLLVASLDTILVSNDPVYPPDESP